MPVDYQEIQNQIREMGSQAAQRAREQQQRSESALEVLRRCASDLDSLRRRALESRQRCAVPLDQPLDFYAPAPPDAPRAVLLAADGSQVNPNRNDSVQFGVINVGVFRMRPGSAPDTLVRSTLIYDEELYSEQGMIGEEVVALRRDLRERQELLEQARGDPDRPLVTLTDGPLELFRAPQGDAYILQLYEQALEEYVAVLGEMARLKVISAGYVDRPMSDLVVRLLELAQQPGREPEQQRPFRGVSDAELFAQFLPPGQRSAVFGIHSAGAERFSGDLALRFFYLNVGSAARPAVARVEVPAWVGDSEAEAGALHAALLEQCRASGGGYPYAVHRAHEIAVVTFEEKERIEEMIAAELRRRGVNVPLKAAKQRMKNLAGRRSF
jgi:hypothetical protein